MTTSTNKAMNPQATRKHSPLLLLGTKVREKYLEHIKSSLATISKERITAKLTSPKQLPYIPPGLATVLVGGDAASEVYVRMKRKIAKNIGFNDFHHHFKEDVPEEELIELLHKLNSDEKVHGILVQLPLPKHISEQKVISTILPAKDVDGFHPINVGKTLIDCNGDGIASCTPAGVMALLQHYKITTRGKHVVIVGRSNIVGKPLSSLMMQKQVVGVLNRRVLEVNKNDEQTEFDNAITGGDGTVTICHSSTTNLAHFTSQADIVIMAAGIPGLLTANMVRDGVVVVDVGMHRIEENGKVKLIGDVDFGGVAPKAQAITPVPGGVGPMTIALLMSNTFSAYSKWHSERQNGIVSEKERI